MKCFGAAAVLLMSFPAEADDFFKPDGALSGFGLHQSCTSTGNSAAERRASLAYCYGYVSGVSNMIIVAKKATESVSPEVSKKFGVCFGGKPITIAEEAALTVAYIRREPDAMNDYAVNLVAAALQEAFPCP